MGAYSKQVEKHAGNGFTAGLTRRMEHGRTIAWWVNTKVTGAPRRTFTFDAEHNARQFFRNLVEHGVGAIPAEESVEDRLHDAKEILRNPSGRFELTDVVLTPPPNLRKRHHPFGS